MDELAQLLDEAALDADLALETALVPCNRCDEPVGILDELDQALSVQIRRPNATW